MYVNTFTVGQTIRSYDFEGRTDCFVEGVIIACHTELSQERPYFCYELEVTREVFGGEEDTRPTLKAEHVYAPMATMFDYEGRLELVEDDVELTAGPKDDIPAAACKRCGGWTQSGGMSQHAQTQRPVQGRYGCICNVDVDYGKLVEAGMKAQESIQQTLAYMQDRIEKTQRGLDLTKHSIRGQNTVVCMTRNGGETRSFLQKTGTGYNFAGYAYNTPRFAPEDADRIVQELTDNRETPQGCEYHAVFDRDAMEAELASLKESIAWTRNELMGYPEDAA